MNKSPTPFWFVILTITALTLIIPLIVYFCNFHLPSRQIQDWVAFATYLSPFAALFSGCAILYVTLLIHRAATDIDKPLITFRRTRKADIDYPFYEMINGGRSSALSCFVYIRRTGSTSNDTWDLRLICYTLPAGGTIGFSLDRQVSKIAVEYKDIYDHWHTTTCENNENFIESGKQSQGSHTVTKHYDEYM